MRCGTGDLQYLKKQAFGSIPSYLFLCPWLSASAFRLVPLLSVFVEKSLRSYEIEIQLKQVDFLKYFQGGRKTLGNLYLSPSIRLGIEKPCLLYWKKTKKWRLELWYGRYKVTHMKTKIPFIEKINSMRQNFGCKILSWHVINFKLKNISRQVLLNLRCSCFKPIIKVFQTNSWIAKLDNSHCQLFRKLFCFLIPYKLTGDPTHT